MMFLSDFRNNLPSYHEIGNKVLNRMVNLSEELEINDDLSLCFFLYISFIQW